MTENVQPIKADVPDIAMYRLQEWFRKNGYYCFSLSDWNRWDYCDPGLWTVYAVVRSLKTFWIGELGMHVYDDGRVICVTRGLPECLR